MNRAGTTSLFSYLSLHPDICPSSIKETVYFLPHRYGQAPGPWTQYLQHFRHCRDQKYVMESTAGYFYGGRAVASSIRSRLGEVKIVIMLREPVDHLVSWYRYLKSRFLVERDLTIRGFVQRCLDLPEDQKRAEDNAEYFAIESGFYVDFLEDWLDVFGRSVRVFFFERLREDRIAFLEDVCGWLDLDPDIYRSTTLGVENKSVRYRLAWLQRLALLVNDRGERFWRRHPRLKRSLRGLYYSFNSAAFQQNLPDELQQELKELYRPYNQRLGRLLREWDYGDFPAWLRLVNS